MTKVPRRTTPAEGTTKTPAKQFDAGPIAAIFADFRRHKTTAEAETIAANKLRDDELMPALVQAGVAHGEKGQHLAIDLPEEIDGFVRLVRRANVSRLLDLDKAEKMLKKKGVLEECQVVSVTITGIPATRLEELETALAKLKLEKAFGVLPSIDTQFSQDAMMAVHQKHRQELQDREEKGEKVGVRERGKYLLDADLDSLVIEETTYSFHPEKK